MTTDDIAVPGGVPPGYGEALYWKLTTSRSRVLLVNLLALVSLVPWGALFFWVAVSAGWLPASIDFGAWQLLLALILATVVVLVLHELLHGATMALFGARRGAQRRHPRRGQRPPLYELHVQLPELHPAARLGGAAHPRGDRALRLRPHLRCVVGARSPCGRQRSRAPLRRPLHQGDSGVRSGGRAALTETEYFMKNPPPGRDLACALACIMVFYLQRAGSEFCHPSGSLLSSVYFLNLIN